MRISATLLALLLVGCGAGSPDIKASDAWVRATAPGQKCSAAYLTLTNEGTGDDQLIGASSPVGETSIHSTTMDGGVMRMRPAEALPVPAGGTLVLKSSGNHIMIMGLTQPLAVGDTLPLRLRFAKSGEMQVEAQVRSSAPSDHGM